mmetsp:Transcript_37959/g.63706  ORF Transcript_37959/g.63706 Transcript_37959/m.63706 type:complete len:964 (+) Transcript_37959:65-2956(+)
MQGGNDDKSSAQTSQREKVRESKRSSESKMTEEDSSTHNDNGDSNPEHGSGYHKNADQNSDEYGYNPKSEETAPPVTINKKGTKRQWSNGDESSAQAQSSRRKKVRKDEPSSSDSKKAEEVDYGESYEPEYGGDYNSNDDDKSGDYGYNPNDSGDYNDDAGGPDYGNNDGDGGDGGGYYPEADYGDAPPTPPSLDSQSAAAASNTDNALSSHDKGDGGKSKAERMMAKMGYKSGMGLGRAGQGRLNPVLESTQVSRQGLGFAAAREEMKEELDDSQDADLEGVVEVNVQLEVKWAPEDTGPVPQRIPREWMVTGSDIMFESSEVTEFRKQEAQKQHLDSSSRNVDKVPPPPGYYCRLCDVLLLESASPSLQSNSGNDDDRMSSLKAKLAEHEKSDLHQERMRVMCGEYGSIALQRKIFTAKSRFDDIDDRTFRNARTRSNPFELIKKEGFQNRAALKMAEMDAMTKRLFTLQPQNLEARERMKRPGEERRPVYFADICAGPGGFSEFMLSVLKWRAKGFGFTLRGSNDFKLYKFNPSSIPQAFRAFYGVDDTGDITKTANMRDFQRKVFNGTENGGVHMVLADGGFSVRGGRENQQELLSQQLVLCQFTTALMTLRKGGTFVCKLFDTFLPFTVHCMYILKRCFRKFALLKPNQSRPANSERYALFTGLKKERPSAVIDYLLAVNDTMSDFRRKNEKKRVTRLVPKSEMDKDFLEYVRAWNNSNAKRQIMSLNKLMRFILDRTLPSDNQEKIRQECVTFWGLSSSSPSPQDRHFERKQQQQRTPPFVNLDKNDGMKLFYAANNRGYHHNAPVRDPWRRDENAHKIRQTMETECLDWRLQVPFGTQGGSRGNSSSSSSSSSFAETLRKAKTFMHNPREWFCYRLPSGGQRTYLLATPSGIVMENLDANRGGGGGRRQRRFQRLAVRLGRHQGIPPDTVLEVVVCGQYIYAIDALCLGGDFNVIT